MATQHLHTIFPVPVHVGLKIPDRKHPVIICHGTGLEPAFLVKKLVKYLYISTKQRPQSQKLEIQL